MKQNKCLHVTLNELFGMAKAKEPKMARLARKTGISRATLYRIKKGVSVENIEFSTYGKLARFVTDDAS